MSEILYLTELQALKLTAKGIEPLYLDYDSKILPLNYVVFILTKYFLYKQRNTIFVADYFLRRKVESLQNRNLLLKVLLLGNNRYFGSNNYAFFVKKILTNWRSKTQQKNFCSVTTRTQSVFKTFRLTRHSVHAKGSAGLLVGLTKSSW